LSYKASWFNFVTCNCVCRLQCAPWMV